MNLALAAEAEGASAPDPEMLVKLQSLASQLLGARALGSGNAIAEEKPSQPSAPAVKFNKVPRPQSSRAKVLKGSVISSFK